MLTPPRDRFGRQKIGMRGSMRCLARSLMLLGSVLALALGALGSSQAGGPAPVAPQGQARLAVFEAFTRTT